jgi:hypothetical protein
MTQQANKSGDSTPAIAPLRTLAELGDEGTGRCAKTDLTPRLPFPVYPGWYESYWFGDRLPSKWGVLVNTVWGLCTEMSRIAESIRRVSPHTSQRPRSVHTQNHPQRGRRPAPRRSSLASTRVT